MKMREILKIERKQDPVTAVIISGRAKKGWWDSGVVGYGAGPHWWINVSFTSLTEGLVFERWEVDVLCRIDCNN